MSKITIVDSTMINVLNYSKSLVSVPTQINPDGYSFAPSIDDQPSLIPLSFAEIRVINGQSQIFKEGYLRFDSDIEEDVYNALNIRDWQNILSDDEIKETIINPTKDKLERLLKITSLALFDRIRTTLVVLRNMGLYDISTRVSDMITARYGEIYEGKKAKYKSEIVITKTAQEEAKAVQADIIADEIAKVKAELEKKIRAEIEAEMKANVKVEPKPEIVKPTETVEKPVETKEMPKVENKPQAGRPKSK